LNACRFPTLPVVFYAGHQYISFFVHSVAVGAMTAFSDAFFLGGEFFDAWDGFCESQRQEFDIEKSTQRTSVAHCM
jgi:hypothetical protein